jgi:N-acetylneuraminic acid mutarotase
MVLVLPVAVSLIACGPAPSGTAGRLTNRTAAATNARPIRLGGQANGTGWIINSPIPEPLGVAQGAVVASADGSRIYHIGGITGAMTPTKKVLVYSPADDTWSEAADIPVSTGIRTFGAAVELNGFIYVFGGVDETGVLDTTWIYDETKDAWSRGTNMPGPRFGSAVVADGTVIWVAGGAIRLSRVGSESGSIWQYDPGTNTWPLADGTPVFLGRSRGVALPNGDLHLLVGGFDGVTHTGVNFREHYSFSRPQIPFGVTDAAVVRDGSRIYVAGGGGPAPRAPGRTQIFDTVSRTWSLGPTMPSGLDNTSGTIANGILYVMGGYDGLTPVSVNYSLPLTSMGTQETISAGSWNPDAIVDANSGELKLESGLNGTAWAINWPIPEALGCAQGSTLASSDGYLVYHLGGLIAGGLYLSNRLRVYSPVDDMGDASAMRSPWWDAASIPLSRGIRSYGSAVELNGFLYIFGGISGSEASGLEVLNTTWTYDEANDSWSRGANMPDFSFGSAVATDGAVIWVIGGFGPGHTVWRYDPNLDAYATGFANMPIDLGRIHGVWLLDGTVHVFGGFDSEINHHLVYDTIGNAWSFGPATPLRVVDPATVTDGSLIYLAGSPAAPRFLEPGHIQIFDPVTNTWSEGPRMPGPYGIDNTSGTIGSGVFYVMGGTLGGGSTISVSYSIPVSELRPSAR